MLSKKAFIRGLRARLSRKNLNNQKVAAGLQPLLQNLFAGLQMLYLSRKVGESIIINNSIELTVVEVRGKTAKIGFTFPPDVTVLRKEIHDKITEANQQALQTSQEGDELLLLAEDALKKPET